MKHTKDILLPLKPNEAKNGTDASTHLEVNLFHWGKRGITLSVGPVCRKPDGTVSFVCFSSKSIKIEDATRVNAKRLAAVFQDIQESLKQPDSQASQLVQAVLKENNLELA